MKILFGGGPDNRNHKGVLAAIGCAKNLFRAGLYLAEPWPSKAAEGMEVSPGIMGISALAPVGGQDMTRASQQCGEVGNRKPTITRLMREDVLDAIEVVSPEDRLSRAKGI